MVFSRWDTAELDLQEHAGRVVPSEDKLTKLMDLLPSSCVKHLERHHAPLDFVKARKETVSYFDVEQAYPGSAGALNRQRAVWDSNRHQMNTPLNTSPGSGNTGGGTACRRCKGNDHQQHDIAAAKSSQGRCQ